MEPVQKQMKTGGWLYRQLRRRIPALAFLAGANILGAYLGVIFAAAMQQVIDSAVSGSVDGLVRSCSVLMGIILIRVLCNSSALHLEERLMADLDRDMKQNLIRRILAGDYSEIARFHSGDLVNRLNGDIRNVYSGVLTIVSSATSLLSSLIGAIYVLLGMAPGFTVAIVCISAAISLLTLLIQQKMKLLHKKASEATGKVSGFLQESIENLLVVQALDVAPEIQKRSDRLLEERWQIQRKRKNITMTMGIGSSILSYVGGLVTLVWCSVKLLNGEISFGQLTAMTALVSQLQAPMLMLPTMIPKFISVIAAAERLMEIDGIPMQEQVEGSGILYEKITGITAKDLSFAYDRDPVIQEANFTIPTGGLTVIVGASGIGKSTLLKLMLGIYKPTDGELVLDTEDGEISLVRNNRSLFSYAPQGNLLLSGTLRENLLLTRPDATETEIETALYASAMDEYVRSLPQGLDTPLGENGAGLSEGQAQRLSLARAVLSGAPILLLDEVTSALDAQTEKTVLERMTALPGKTCIAVTHRSAALELADWKLTVSGKGMVLSPGSHSK